MAMFGGGNNMFQTAEPQDVKLNAPPSDGISSLAFSSNNILAAGSWDHTVRCWRLQRAGNQIQAETQHLNKYDGPVLCTTFKPEGDMLFTGGADNTVRMLNMQTGQASLLGRHDQPVKSIHWLPVHNMVVTGSWDSTVRFWSPGKPGAEAFKLQLKQKVYAMDVSYPMMVVSTAETGGSNNTPLLHVYDITFQSGQPILLHTLESTLKHQTRCVSIFNNKNMPGAVVNNTRHGFAVGSVEGRVVIKDLDDLQGKRTFAFKCHRHKRPQNQQRGDIQDVYPVNAITFNPRGTFATAGSDGVFNFWDKEHKQRLKEFKVGQGCRQGQAAPNGLVQSISAATFNPAGDLFAYAMSYDWSQGDNPQQKALPNEVWVHAVQENEVVPNKKK